MLTADADAEALMRAVLSRHKALQIRPVAFDIKRLPGRDNGMVNEGPEIARVLVNKSEHARLLLMWDHHGSGWEKRNPDQATIRIQERLNGVTWMGRSSAMVLVPELEEWLWHCPESIAAHLGVSNLEFAELSERAAIRLAKPLQRCKREYPKELFGIVFHGRKRRQPLPEDFRVLGSSADLTQWRASETFGRFTQVLQEWFPVKPV